MKEINDSVVYNLVSSPAHALVENSIHYSIYFLVDVSIPDSIWDETTNIFYNNIKKQIN